MGWTKKVGDQKGDARRFEGERRPIASTRNRTFPKFPRQHSPPSGVHSIGGSSARQPGDHLSAADGSLTIRITLLRLAAWPNQGSAQAVSGPFAARVRGVPRVFHP
jgi:hypothetical protein